MSIPLISGLGFTEVDSAGTLNDKAGDAKSKLPIQFFRLTDNISGNLTLNDNAAHKKIILDTNGKTITNSSGSPLTTNSSIALELKGSGNVQSTLKTFTASESSTSHTGTTIFSNSDSSTLVVATSDTDSTQTAVLTRTAGTFTEAFGSRGQVGLTWNEWPSAFQNVDSSVNGGGNLASGVRLLGVTTSSASAPSGGSTLALPRGCDSQTSLRNSGVATPSAHAAVLYQDCASGNPYKFYILDLGVGSSFKVWLTLPSTQNNRSLTFTNNLAISCVLSGGDPYSDVTVTAGSTAVVTRSDSTDGSFDLTGTIEGNNGDSQPYALVPANDGAGSINTDAYTGTLSASAL